MFLGEPSDHFLLAVAVSLLCLVVGTGLWRFREWARKAEVAICCVQILALVAMVAAWMLTRMHGSLGILDGLIFICLLALNVFLLGFFRHQQVRYLFEGTK
jgi:hypothetical protein